MMYRFVAVIVVLFSLSTVTTILAGEATFSVPIPSKNEILKTLRPEHPRLILPAGEEKRILKTVAENPKLGELFEKLKEKAEKELTEDPVTYEIQVRSQPTILMTSRKAKNRILLHATLYRLTKEKKHLDRAVLEMETVCRFKDWNHRCFLDTAEMTFGVAIGYDWLYHDLGDDQRKLFRESIRDKGLVHGIAAYEKKAGWTRSAFNWNQVCAGGLTVGALAIAEDEPKLAAEIVHRAASGVQIAMREFSPDGGTREGPTYWSYALSFTAYLLASLDTALGTDFGLSTFPGFADTGRFRIHFTTPMKTVFTFGDTGSKADANPYAHWLTRKCDRPAYAWQDRMLFEPTMPQHLWWYVNEGDAANEPTSAHFQHAGLVFMRSTWDADAVYVGIKAGTNAAGHAHLELGHFQLNADDRLWCGDLGNVPYTRDYFRGNTRWTFYRATNLAHNVPHIDGKLQNPKGIAPITLFEITPKKTVTELDLSDAYKDQVDKALRRFTLEDRILTVEDVFHGVRGERFTWQIHAPVRMAVIDKKNPRQANLQHLYKRMRMEILEPEDAVFETEEIVVPEGQPPAKDTVRIVVRRDITTEPIRVKIRFCPQKEAARRNQPTGE